MQLGVVIFLVLILIVWLIVITWYFFKLRLHYNSLVGSSDKKSLQETLDVLLRDGAHTKKQIEELTKRCDTIDADGKLHIQKIGLLRYNPFKDTGGDQSFILALVDAHDTGIVISGLYSRSGTRWYAKKVIRGQALEHDLSAEEKKAIAMAKAA